MSTTPEPENDKPVEVSAPLEAETEISPHEVDVSDQQPPQQPPLEEVREPKPRPVLHRSWKVLEGALGTLGTLATLSALYFAFPSWTLSLPSSAYHPRNPFTAIFTLTNSGYLPADSVKVVCIQNLVEYVDPAGLSSYASTSPVGGAPWGETNR